jgi:hypothetical protein
MQQTESDEVVVVMKFRESGKERRASVIQLEVFLNNPVNLGRMRKENDKIITDQ